MNDFIKNLDLDYHHVGGSKTLYPKDLSFIKAWESADYTDEVGEKFDYDLRQKHISSTREALTRHVKAKALLEEQGSIAAFHRSHQNDATHPYVGEVRFWRCEEAINDGDIESDKTQAYETSTRFTRSVVYYFYRDYTEVVEELNEKIGELQDKLIKYEGGTLGYSCYEGGVNTLRNKKYRIEEKYRIDLKPLSSRPKKGPSIADFVQTCRNAFIEFDAQRKLSAE